MATFGNQLAVLRWELQRPSSSECTHPDDGGMQQETGLLLTKELKYLLSLHPTITRKPHFELYTNIMVT